MNFESNRRLEVARTEDEMYEMLESLKSQGYAESDIHVISKDRSHMSTLSRHSEVTTHEAGTLKDTFKSWFTGEDAVKEGLRPLNLSEGEKDRYSKDIASGGFVLYTDQDPTQNEFEEGYDTFGSTGNSYESYHGEQPSVPATKPGFENRVQSEDPQLSATSGTEFVESRFTQSETKGTTTFGAQEPLSENTFNSKREEPSSTYAKKHEFEPSTNDFVNETDGRLDEPTDRFARSESFSTNPYLTKEVDHMGHSMQEDRTVQEHRPTIDESTQSYQNEPITEAYKTEGFQSPGTDPNLGPAAFGNEEDAMNLKHDFDKDPRNTDYKTDTGYEEDGHGNAFAFDTKSTSNEMTSGGVDEDEDITKNQYEKHIDEDKYRGNNASSNKLF
ncbi:MAG: general stress protein [Paenisporosarcina sp.]